MENATSEAAVPHKMLAESMTIADHEMASRHRYGKLCEKLKTLKENIVSTPDVNVYQKDPMAGVLPLMMGGMGGGVGAGAGAGAGLGAGLLGGILGGALLGGNGLLGNRAAVAGVAEGCVTPTQLTAALAGVEDNQMNTAVLSQLGRIEAAIPYNEGQVQLALAGAQAALSNQASAYQISNIQGFANTNAALSTATAGIIAVGETVKDTVNMTSAATNLAIANLATSQLQNTYALNTAIRDDGDKTRALIVAQNDQMLNRQLAVAEAALLEQRAIHRSAATEVNVTQTVNQNQLQLQQQQQQQQQLILLSQIANGLANVTQIAHATNSNIIAGNSGAVATGPQSANPVNVNA